MKPSFKTVFEGSCSGIQEGKYLFASLAVAATSENISGMWQCHELLPLPQGLCTLSNSHKSRSVSYDWKYHMGWQRGAVVKWCIFQLLSMLYYTKWQIQQNFKVKSWREWSYSNKWTTETFDAHIKKYPAITFQLYFFYFQATNCSWQLFMKRDQCAKVCSAWNNSSRKIFQ